MVRNQKTVIDELRKGLEDDEADYLRARKIIDSPDKALEFLNSLKDRMLPLMAYDPNTQPAHSAVFVVSCIKERLSGVFQDLQFVTDYEERKKEYKANVKRHVGIDDEPEVTSNGPHD